MVRLASLTLGFQRCKKCSKLFYYKYWVSHNMYFRGHRISWFHWTMWFYWWIHSWTANLKVFFSLDQKLYISQLRKRRKLVFKSNDETVLFISTKNKKQGVLLWTKHLDSFYVTTPPQYTTPRTILCKYQYCVNTVSVWIPILCEY